MVATIWQPMVARARPMTRPYLLALGVWAIAVLLPMLELSGEVAALEHPRTRWLCLLPPLATTWAWLAGTPATLLGVGLLGVLPALVAVPELVDPPAAAGIRGAAAALAVALFVASCLDRSSSDAPLRQLWRWPASLGGRVLRLVGAAWLAMAWVFAEEARTGRVAAVALTWVAVVTLPVGAGHERFARHGWRWLFARLLWVLVVVLLWRFGREGA